MEKTKNTYTLIRFKRGDIIKLTEKELQKLQKEFGFDEIRRHKNYTEARAYMLKYFNFEKELIREQANRFKYGKKEDVLTMKTFKDKTVIFTLKEN